MLEKMLGHHASVTSVAFTPDGRGIISGSHDMMLMYWDVGPVVSRLHRTPGLPAIISPDVFASRNTGVNSVTVSHDGQWLASGTRDGTVQLWNRHTRQEHVSLRGHTESIIGVEFSPSGGMLASCCEDSNVCICQ